MEHAFFFGVFTGTGWHLLSSVNSNDLFLHLLFHAKISDFYFCTSFLQICSCWNTDEQLCSYLRSSHEVETGELLTFLMDRQISLDRIPCPVPHSCRIAPLTILILESNMLLVLAKL